MLLALLRNADVYVLERGAIEDTTPTLSKEQTSRRVPGFLHKVATRDDILACMRTTICRL
jgi:hypothetical protein